MTQAFANTLGIPLDTPKENSNRGNANKLGDPYVSAVRKNHPNIPAPVPCLSIKGCCNDPNAVMAPLENLKINRTIKLWSPCSLNSLISYINKNGRAEFCLFRMKNSKSCSCKLYI